MHIRDALLSPAVCVATGLVGAGGITYALRRLRGHVRDRTPARLGIMAAFVFAAQMVNFPLGVAPVSGHLLGGVLAAVMLGPWGGALAIGLVLLVQCFLFADGGVTVLGANFVNMGLVGAVGGWAIYGPIRRAIGGPAGVMVGGMLAAWFSVLLASAAFAVELAASGRWADFPRVLGWMTLVHAGIGLGESLITGLVLQAVLRTRPDLIADPDGPAGASWPRRWAHAAAAGLAVSLAVAAFLAPLASEHDDGLEWVAGRLGFGPDGAATAIAAPWPDYALPGLAGGAATAAAGVVGTLVVFAAALVLGRAATGSGGPPGHAA